MKVTKKTKKNIAGQGGGQLDTGGRQLGAQAYKGSSHKFSVKKMWQ